MPYAPYASSPYSPASRLYWNQYDLDLGAIAAERGVPAPVTPPVAPGLIDYRAKYKWRRAAICGSSWMRCCREPTFSSKRRAGVNLPWPIGSIT